ncbi:MAG: sugar ABC transporter permease [Chloroflexi bacterium]|nr:sugar ABC transporter permease [Chloroflexota bacterium]
MGRMAPQPARWVVGRVHLRQAQREEIAFYLFILPWIAGFLVFWAGPMLASIAISFTQWDILTPPSWTGVSNFQKLATDPLFYHSLKVTTIWVLGAVPLHQLVSLALALLLNQRVPGRSLFRTLFYMPAAVSGVAVALLWLWLLDPYLGLLNFVLEFFGLPGPKWFTSETWALPGLIVMSLWSVGVPMVLYLAGLQGVPEELYESAAIDGAGELRKFLYITIPMLSPVILFNLVWGVIGSFQVFTQVYVMTQGGPNRATLFYVLYLYRNAFEYFEMGYASALAWGLFLIVIALTILQFKLSDRWVHYQGG